MKTFAFLLLCVILSASSCKPAEKTPPVPCPEAPLREHSMQAVLWQQNAGEYRALCYQAFNLASQRLTNWNGEWETRPAIVTDIDETVLDNSPYSGMQVQKNADFSKDDWKAWGMQQSAEALPGAVSFFQLADSLGFEVFYISNRYQNQLTETLENMRAHGLPNADTSHVFLKTETSAKQARRDRVLADHQVVLYLGDNLSDFSSVFDGKSTQERNHSVDDMQSAFGDRFIVFPNPMYGDWESKGIYEGSRDWTTAQKDSLRHANIRSFE